MLGLAASLEIAAIAEGVERDEQVHALRALGCRLAEGFRFCEPIAPERIPDEIAAGVRAAPSAPARLLASACGAAD